MTAIWVLVSVWDALTEQQRRVVSWSVIPTLGDPALWVDDQERDIYLWSDPRLDDAAVELVALYVNNPTLIPEEVPDADAPDTP
jgi:hypothetical protein